MPLQPSKRAEACRALGRAYELAQEALLTSDGEKQVQEWREVAHAAGLAARACIQAVQEALQPPKRGKR